MLQRGAGHLDTVLLLGQLGQLVLDQLPSALALAGNEPPDLSQREPDLAEEEDRTDVLDRRLGVAATSRCSGHRLHQATFVVVPQRARRHAGTFGQLTTTSA